MLTPHNRSDSSDFANFVFHTKSEAGSLPVENCQQFRDPAENFSQVSLACSSIEQCSGDSAQVANSTQDSVPSCGACDENAGFFDFESFMNMRGPALDVKIVAVTAKTSLSQKIDLEKLCSADSTHFGFRVAKLDNSQEAPRQTQDFRNSIQYLLAFPTSCDEKKIHRSHFQQRNRHNFEYPAVTRHHRNSGQLLASRCEPNPKCPLCFSCCRLRCGPEF